MPSSLDTFAFVFDNVTSMTNTNELIKLNYNFFCALLSVCCNQAMSEFSIMRRDVSVIAALNSQSNYCQLFQRFACRKHVGSWLVILDFLTTLLSPPAACWPQCSKPKQLTVLSTVSTAVLRGKAQQTKPAQPKNPNNITLAQNVLLWCHNPRTFGLTLKNIEFEICVKIKIWKYRFTNAFCFPERAVATSTRWIWQRRIQSFHPASVFCWACYFLADISQVLIRIARQFWFTSVIIFFSLSVTFIEYLKQQHGWSFTVKYRYQCNFFISW